MYYKIKNSFKNLYFFTLLGEDALPNGLDVTFEVTELRRWTGSYNTTVGNNEGSMVSAMVTCNFGASHSRMNTLVLKWILL